MPELALFLGDAPERWAELGFSVSDDQLELGGVRLVLEGTGRGITAWTLDAVDGLTSRPSVQAVEVPHTHPNGADGVDHIVVITPAFERTRDALEAAGMPLKRIADMRGTRMGFRRIGPAILEIVETPHSERAAFWGLVVVVRDLDVLAAQLADRLGEIRPAVQPGRRIATVSTRAGLGTNLAFMDPDPR